MTRWRFSLSLILAVLVALPLAWPLGELPQSGLRLDFRLATLAANSCLLIGGALAIALPLGITLAVLLARTDLPGRRLFSTLLLASLFIPLPLFVAGWQPVASSLPGGLTSAVFLHSLAELPWVTLIVGLGLRAVERELEDDARTIRPPLWVLWRVTLPRCSLSIVAAALWVAARTAGEVTITDLMQVRTFAEEVYTQLVAPESEEPVGRAVAAALVGVVAMVGVVLFLARHSDRLLPPGDVSYRDALSLPLGPWRWPLFALVGLIVVSLLGVPATALAYRAGLTGAPATWSVFSLGGQLQRTTRLDGWLLVRSLLVATASGVLAATVALIACWSARGSRRFGLLLLVLLAAAWAMPGPLVGLGWKGVFRAVLESTEGVSRLPGRLLWYGPSVAPLLAVNFVRFLPFAAAILWPAVRRIPRELFDLSRLDGIPPGHELARIVWPLARGAWLRATLAVSILSLGELSAGKLVSTPGAESFAEVVWTQMHYGVSPDLAAKCLVLLAVVAAGPLVVSARRQ